MIEECFEIKNKICDLRSYISSDFCTNAKEIYQQIKKLEEKLKIIEDQNQTHD